LLPKAEASLPKNVHRVGCTKSKQAVFSHPAKCPVHRDATSVKVGE
jgi:hypothetical protein